MTDKELAMLMMKVASELLERDGKSKSEHEEPVKDAEIWTIHSSKGPVPKWVLSETGLKTKIEIKGRYGTTATFVKGKKLPPVVQVPEK